VHNSPEPLNAYAEAGVNIAAGDLAVELMKQHVSAATRPEVLSSLGGFSGLFDASALTKYRRPVLSTSTDGVGTKIAIAQALDIHDTIGIDLVAMVVDDIVVTGAEPLFMTDYIACGKVIPEKIATIVSGIAQGCATANVALIGGETAEHPGVMDENDYDIAGAATGVVEYDEILGADRIKPGDHVVALASSGLHSNGFSLVRTVIAQAGLDLSDYVAEFGRSLGEELLTPTRIYARDVLSVMRATPIHAMSHITGAGLGDNVARIIPDSLEVTIDRSTWRPAAIFDFIQRVGRISRDDMEATLNMGVGMVLVMPEGRVSAAVDMFAELGIEAWLAGEVTRRSTAEAVRLVGNHAK
jgi:phosphoribosylformylglycinamidine cyclo-ligase